MRLAVATPAVASPRKMQKRREVPTRPASEGASDRNVVDEASLSSGSSNVPRRSINPQAATATNAAPIGTPQRSCP